MSMPQSLMAFYYYLTVVSSLRLSLLRYFVRSHILWIHLRKIDSGEVIRVQMCWNDCPDEYQGRTLYLTGDSAAELISFTAHFLSASLHSDQFISYVTFSTSQFPSCHLHFCLLRFPFLHPASRSPPFLNHISPL
jgi:hypothetical protein